MVLLVLQELYIQPSSARRNVAHWHGQEVESLCIGLSARSPELAARTLDLENVYRLLARWLRQDPSFSDFAFTSITINKNHASAVHRDIGNCGLSVIRILGSFEGGYVYWFPEDDGSMPIASFADKCPEEEAVFLPMSEFTSFDGRRAHGVTPFQGERFSVIFFTTVTSTERGAERNRRLLQGWQS